MPTPVDAPIDAPRKRACLPHGDDLGAAGLADPMLERHRVMFPDRDRWAKAETRIQTAKDGAIAAGTRGVLNVAMNHWRRFTATVVRCDSLIDVRGRLPNSADHAKERNVLEHFVDDLVNVRKVAPDSARNYTIQVRNWFRRERQYALGGVDPPTARGQRAWLGEIIHGLNVKRAKEGGPPIDKKPAWKRVHFRSANRRRTSSADDTVVYAAITVGVQVLLRRSEFCKPQKKYPEHNTAFNHHHHMSRASVRWFRKGGAEIYPVTPAALADLVDGDYCSLKLGLSKTDSDGRKYGWLPVCLIFSRTHEINSARELVALERARPCSDPEERKRRPLFEVTGAGKQLRWLTGDFLQKKMSAWTVGTGQRVTSRSLRVGGLCSLVEMGLGPAEIQRLGRWTSDAYTEYERRTGADSVARLRLRISGQDAASEDFLLRLPPTSPSKGPLLALVQ